MGWFFSLLLLFIPRSGREREGRRNSVGVDVDVGGGCGWQHLSLCIYDDLSVSAWLPTYLPTSVLYLPTL